MAFWHTKAGGDGWTALMFCADRVAMADVERRAGARPRVHAGDVFAREGDDLTALKRLKNARRPWRKRRVALLCEGQYQLLQAEAPDNITDLPRQELREALRWRIKEMVDFPVEQAGIDVVEIPAAGSRARQLWVVAARHETVRDCVHLFQDARVALDAIDIPEMAQRNLAGLFEEENRGLALVGFDPRESGGGLLTITWQGELIVMRHLEASGPALSRPGAAALHERILLDIQRTLDNFDRNYSMITINRLLVGPLPGGEEFVAYLAANLSLPVAGANLCDVLDLSAVPALEDPAVQAENWLALGAALREE